MVSCLSKVASKLKLHCGSLVQQQQQSSYKICFGSMVICSVLLTVLLVSIVPMFELPQLATHGWSGNETGRHTLLAMLQKFANSSHRMGDRIPKIFHQTYKSAMLPAEYKPYVTACRNLNPDWQYFLWRDVDIEAFMAEHFPQYVRKYRSFSMNVQRADLIRYMVLYHYGGVYLDMDVDCVKPFFPSLASRRPAFLDQERREHAHILYNRQFTAMNSAMGSVARHPFFLYMLESVNQVGDRIEGAGFTTGPDRLTMAYREWAASPCQRAYPVNLLEPAVFSPLVDIRHHFFRKHCQQKKGRWLEAGCKMLDAKNWSADATDNSTVGKHLFLHMGYSWGPRSRAQFDVTTEPGSVFLYTTNPVHYIAMGDFVPKLALPV